MSHQWLQYSISARQGIDRLRKSVHVRLESKLQIWPLAGVQTSATLELRSYRQEARSVKQMNLCDTMYLAFPHSRSTSRHWHAIALIKHDLSAVPLMVIHHSYVQSALLHHASMLGIAFVEGKTCVEQYFCLCRSWPVCAMNCLLAVCQKQSEAPDNGDVSSLALMCFATIAWGSDFRGKYDPLIIVALISMIIAQVSVSAARRWECTDVSTPTALSRNGLGLKLSQ